MKTILITIFSLGVIGTASAQGKGKLEMGLSAGVNVAYISDDYGSSDSHVGFNVSGSADYYFSDDWSMKVKLIYDQKGFDDATIEDFDTGELYSTNYEFNYVTVPILASWHFAPKRNWYLHFGPYIGFLTSAKDTRFDVDVKDDFDSTDFGVAVGIGVKIPLNQKFRLFFEYDVQAGLTDIVNTPGFSETNNARYAFNMGLNFLAN